MFSKEGQEYHHHFFHQVRPDDVGNYTCVAENLINRRVSPPARLDIFGETFFVTFLVTFLVSPPARLDIFGETFFVRHFL